MWKRKPKRWIERLEVRVKNERLPSLEDDLFRAVMADIGRFGPKYLCVTFGSDSMFEANYGFLSEYCGKPLQRK